MDFLFDTHLLLWALEGSEKLPRKAFEILMNPKNQIYYSRLDPVVTENVIRNGRVKGVYNTLDSYNPEGGLINQLNKLSNLNGTLTYPKTDSPLRYYLCGRKNGKIGEAYNQIFVTLGYNSNLTLDCTDSYFNFQSR